MGKSMAKQLRQTHRNKKRRLRSNSKPKNISFPSPATPSTASQTKNPVLDRQSADSDDSGATADGVRRLLEPYTKDQLITFLLDAVVADPGLLARIEAAADKDASHRKLFVHGLGWDATRETLVEAFQPYGPIEDCNVIVHKATGRNKGYGFVLFKQRKGAIGALKQPEKKIGNRITHCQLAAIGTAAGSGGNAAATAATDVSGRKIYISNVHPDATPDKLKAFFGQFGEIESGPFGYDMLTGKCRGFAIFVYKTMEGARKALDEPYKLFEGHRLHCQYATDKGKAAAVTPAAITEPQPQALLGARPESLLATVAAAQNLGLYNQDPAYAALLGQYPLLAASTLNQVAGAMALNPALGLLSSQGQGWPGNASAFGGMPALLGAYGSQGLAGLQGLQTYQQSQLGATLSKNPDGSTFGGFPY